MAPTPTPTTATTVSAGVLGGTRQDLTDAGCVAHDPSLYNYNRCSTGAAQTLQEAHQNVTVLLEQYQQQGCLVIPQAFKAQLADLQAALQALTTGQNKQFKQDVQRQLASGKPPSFTQGQQIAWVQYEAGTNVNDILSPTTAPCVRKLMGFCGYEPAIDTVVQDSTLLALVAQLLHDDKVQLFQAQAMLKPAKGGREKPWHQDTAYFDVAHSTPVVGCWIALDEATPQNGCLRMLQGGHLQGPRPHFALRDYQICDDEILQRSSNNNPNHNEVVAIALPPGGLVLFNGMIPHGTPTNNTTNQPRRALQFHWMAKNSKRVGEHEPGGRAEVFGGAHQGLTC